MQDEPKAAPKETLEERLAKKRAERLALRGQEEPPREKPMSLSGFSENLLANAWQIAKGTVAWIPTVMASGAEVFGDPEGLAELMQRPEFLAESLKETASHVGKAMVEPYRKHGFKVLYHEPLTPVLDAMTVVSLGGAGVLRAGRVAQSARMIELGRAMEGLPARIGAKLTELPLRAVGIDPKMRTLWQRFQREEQSINMGRGQQVLESLDLKLTPDEGALLDRVIHAGGKRADLPPKVAAAYDKLSTWLKAEREAELGSKGRVLKTDEELAEAVVKKYRDRAEQDGRTLSHAEAAKEIAALELKPLYAPAIREKAGRFTLDDALAGPSEFRKGKAGFLERFVSGEVASRDPRVYIPRAVADFYSTRARLRVIDRLIQEPGIAKAVGRGEATLAELLKEHGVFKKYYGDDPARAQSVYLRELEAKHGTAKAAEMFAGDPATVKRLGQIRNIAVEDPTLQRLIMREFRTTGGEFGWWLKLYDRMTDMFRSAATVFPTSYPRFFTGNAVGDAILSSLAGARWGRAKRMLTERFMPAGASAPRIQIAETGAGGRFTQSLAEAVQHLDDAGHAGIISKDLERKLKGTLVSFTASHDEIEKAVRAVAMAPEELSNATVALQQLGEHMARRSVKVGQIDRQIARLTASRQKLTGTSSDLQARLRARDLQRPAVEGQPIRVPLGVRVSDEAWAKMTPGEKVTAAMQELKPAGGKAGRPVRPDTAGEAMRAKGADAQKGIARIDDELAKLQSLRENIVADMRDQAVKRGELDQLMPGLREKAEMARGAVDRSNAFLGDYLGLGPIERGVFRRLIPFYAWTKAMSKLAFTLPFLAPAKTFFWHRYSAALIDMMGDGELPEWAAPYAPVFALANGNTVWARLTNVNPFTSARTTTVGGAPIPAMLAFWQQNPWISVGYRLIGGRDEFVPGGVPYGETAVAVNDGDVYRFNERGKLEKIVPQAPLVKSLMHLFPPVQFADQLIANYDVRKGPALNRDGTPRYPMEMYQRLASFVGARVMEGNREDMIRMEKFRVRKVLDELRSEYRRSGPDERETIRQIFEDYARGEYRRIEAKR